MRKYSPYTYSLRIFLILSFLLVFISCNNVVNNQNEQKNDYLVPEMIFVKGDTILGIDNLKDYESVFINNRVVTISDFYIGKYEITQSEYQSIMQGQTINIDGRSYPLESNPSFCLAENSDYTLFNNEKQQNRPVEGVSWFDAIYFCNILSKKENLTPAYDIQVTEVRKAEGKSGYYIYDANVSLNKDSNGYRLPTEAEWEYAARGGKQNSTSWKYSFSGANTAENSDSYSMINSGLDNVAWYCFNNINGTSGEEDVTLSALGKGTHEVGKKHNNALGIYDMSGNVFEWCFDWYNSLKEESITDPIGDTISESKVGRGGSWFSQAYFCSVSFRYFNSPCNIRDYLGFRVVRSSTK